MRRPAAWKLMVATLAVVPLFSACGVIAWLDGDAVPRLSYAFVSSDLGNEDIYGVAANSRERSDPFFLTCDTAQDNDPAVSDDGSSVAFASDRSGDWDIYVLRGTCLNFDERRDSEPDRLTDDPATDRAPAWSPDEKWIAFHSDRTGSFQIYVIRKNGSNLQQLTDSPIGNWSPSWSPDGENIAFHSGRDGNSELYVMTRDGTNQRRLTNNPAADESPAYSADGARIAFVSDRSDDRSIYLLELNDLAETRVTGPGTDDSKPAWCGSSCIAFISTRDGERDVYYVDDGATAKVLPDSEGQNVASASFARDLLSGS